MKSLAPNTLLQNRYLIVHLIGKGGMGEVYLAVDQRLGSAIALKRTFYADDVQLGGAFEREARTLARLRHPVLPKVSDHFVENGNQFLVMEHISGDDLGKRLQSQQKPFPQSWVLFWADQLLDALAYLHGHEPPIIHRDIKPQNLKLTDDNNIILLDFGLSKNSVGQTNLSTSGGVSGFTPNYAPMEQIRGTGTNPRSDIYSLSATVYQLLTNTVPHDALTRADAMLNGQPDPINAIFAFNNEVTKTISDIILKGMAVSQEQRYSNAREMQKILREGYSQIQGAMGAQTVAMKGPADQTIPMISLPPDNSGQIAAPTFESQPPATGDMFAQTMPIQSVNETHLTREEDSSDGSMQTEEIQDFDATIRYDPKDDLPPVPGTPSVNSQPKQSEIKTEVIMGSDLSVNEYLPEPPPPVDNFVTESFEAGQPENFAAPDNFKGDATIPLISREEPRIGDVFAETMPISSAFDSNPQTTDSGASMETVLPAEYYFQAPPPPEYSEPIPEAVVTEPVQPKVEKKKSKGLMLAVIGGLFALLVLAAGAGGIGWYLYNQPDNQGGSNVATPSPDTSPGDSPSPDTTPLQAETNTDVNSSNTDVNSSNTDVSNSDTNIENPPETPVKTPDRTQTGPTQAPPPKTPVQRPTQVTTPNQKLTPKPTGQPQPTKTVRGTRDIPQ